MDEVLETLSKLGLSKNEGKCYLALLNNYPANPYQISKESGVPTSKIYEVFSRLESRGLIIPVHGDESGFLPKDPEIAMGEWKEEYSSLLDNAAVKLRRSFKKTDHGIVWNLDGLDEVISHGRMMIHKARERVFLDAERTLVLAFLDELTDAFSNSIDVQAIGYGEALDTSFQVKWNERPLRSTSMPRGSVLVTDTESVLFITHGGDNYSGSWAKNRAIAGIAEEYIQDKFFIEELVTDHWKQWLDKE